MPEERLHCSSGRRQTSQVSLSHQCLTLVPSEFTANLLSTFTGGTSRKSQEKKKKVGCRGLPGPLLPLAQDRARITIPFSFGNYFPCSLDYIIQTTTSFKEMGLLVSLEKKMSGSLTLVMVGVGRMTREMVSQSESLGAEWGPKDRATVKVSLQR